MRGQLKTLTSPPRLPKVKHPPQRPQAPAFVPKIETVPGPGDPPDGFLTGQNSATEWIFYWALARVFGEPKDPRKPPFYGGYPFWAYQVAEIGGFVRSLGSAVVDFVIYQGPTILGIRIQTERFHIYTTSEKQAYDAFQRASLEAAGIDVVDVFDDQILGDPSGQKAVIAAKQAVGRIEKVSPIYGGTAIRASRLKVIG